MAKKKKGFAQQLERRTTPESKRRLTQRYASQRSSPASRERFLKKYNVQDPDLDDPGYFQRPQTLQQAQVEASRLGQLRYGPEESQVAQQQINVQPWFQNYRNQVAATSANLQAQAAPVIAQAQQQAQQTGQVSQTGAMTPGGAPSEDATLAAASRQALGQAFATMLQGQLGAEQSYLGQLQGPVAGAAELGKNYELGTQRRLIARERGDYEAGELGRMRGEERQYGLERQAFGLDVAEAESKAANEARDDASARAKDRRARRAARDERKATRQAGRADTRKERADFIAKHGLPPEDVADGITPQERQAMQDYKKPAGGKKEGGGLTPAQRRDRAKGSNTAITNINTIKDRWDDLAGVKDDKGRSPTPSQIKARLRDEGKSSDEIHIALVVRSGKPLSAEDKRIARRLGIYPIPASWKKAKGIVRSPGAEAHPRS